VFGIHKIKNAAQNADWIFQKISEYPSCLIQNHFSRIPVALIKATKNRKPSGDG